MGRPQLLLLDEPAAGLDTRETAELAELLPRVRDRFKVTMLLVDHDMALVMRVCDHIYVLDFGRDAHPGAAGRDPPGPDGDPGLPGRGGRGMKNDYSPLLEVKGLRTGYGRIPVVFGIDLEVEEGEIVALLGANGAGKTTTLRAISGMIPAMAG